MSRPKVSSVYDTYIAQKGSLNRTARYEGMEHWFHASAAGMCKRKIYFESVEKIQPTKKNADTLRLFRLGDLVHGDIQRAFEIYAQRTGARILIEKEIRIEDLNVRGFLDLALLDHNHLYDIKTCNSFKWKKLFGRIPDANSDVNYQLQLGTYGMCIEQEFGELEGLSIAYYNKNTSAMREIAFDRSIVVNAKQYWLDLNAQFELDGMPEIAFGNAPMQAWECNPKYCSFFHACGGGLKPELLEEKNAKTGHNSNADQNIFGAYAALDRDGKTA
jgi:hypothetical protein